MLKIYFSLKSTITDLVNNIDNSNILSSHCSSSTCEQLLKLLKDSKITGLIEAYDEVARQHWNVNLPETHVDNVDEKPASVKIVKLIKGSEPLGIKMKYGFDGKPYISSIIPDSAADRSGMFQEKDIVLSVNDVYCSSKKELNEIIAMINSGEERQITFQLLPPSLRNCIPLERFKTYEYLRACVNYDPQLDPSHSNPDIGLSFSKGDILELIQVENHHWARAKHYGKADNPIGIIPTDEKLSLCESPHDVISSMPFAYESVCQIELKPDFIRTVVFIGAQGVGRNELRQKLLHHYPDKYKIPIPHTSRPPRPHEKDGIDYHFVSRKQMEEWILNGHFIESGEYNGNLYGTLDAELLRIMSLKKIPVINIYSGALNSVRNAKLCPLVIFIAPPDLQTLKATRSKNSKISKHSQSQKLTDLDLEQIINTSTQIEKLYSPFWDARVVNDDIDVAFGILCSVLQKFESECCWIPLDWVNSYRSH
ncbi:hypothetical protein FO519_000714 [Halicephalobus sp. NKZ332]|nr:hypothetical protein FO519_000714 [Halicephalobus sp. NKZ332]